MEVRDWWRKKNTGVGFCPSWAGAVFFRASEGSEGEGIRISGSQGNMSKKGLPHHHFKRAWASDWESIEPFSTEMGYAENHTGGREAQTFVLWRHSNLLMLIFFFFVAMALAITSLVLSLEDPREERDEADGALRNVYQSVLETETGIVIIKCIVLVVSWILMIVAALKWKSRDLPNTLLRVAWLMTFLLPFALQIVPYRLLVDIEGALDKLGASKGALTTLCTGAKASNEQWKCTDLVSLEDSDCPSNCEDLFDLVVVNIQTIVGASYGVRALITLTPVVLSLFPGLQKGSLIIKSFMPWHPLPGVLALAKPIFYVPLLYTLSAMMYQTVGDQWLALALACLVLSEAVFIIFGRKLAFALDRDAHKKIMKKIGIAQKICYFFFLVFLLLFFLLNDRLFDLLKLIGDSAADYKFDILKIISIIFQSLANAFITNVVTADVILRVVASEHVEMRSATHIVRPQLDNFAEFYDYTASGTISSENPSSINDSDL